jgi:hypothetical protein
MASRSGGLDASRANLSRLKHRMKKSGLPWVEVLTIRNNGNFRKYLPGRRDFGPLNGGEIITRF